MAVDLDDILQQELGRFGYYQVRTYVLLSFAGIFLTVTGLSFVFTAGEVDYRCRIPECGDNGTQFLPEWWQIAAPVEQRAGENVPSRCLRYQTTNQSVSGDSCPAEMFLNSTVRCDDWVFDGDESTIVTEWKILCDENQWKITLVGTMNNVGQFVGTSIAGIVSDKFGRKSSLLGIAFLSCLVGVGRSFSTGYIMFVVLEFVNHIVGGNVMYGSVYILGIELVGPQKRVLGGIIVCLYDAVGEVLVGLISWWIQDWRLQLRIMYGLGFLVLSYYWLLPESVRWLLAKGRMEEAKQVLRNAARTNGVELSEELLQELEKSTITSNKLQESPVSSLGETETSEPPRSILSQVMGSRTLLLRIANCSFSWTTITFVYYGLSLNSVSLAGDKFLNFVLVSVVEIPGYILCYFIMASGLGRKLSLCSSLVVSGICCIAFIFIPTDMTWLAMTLFLLGKLTVTISFGVIYMFTTEMFPTTLRHSLFGFCSMVGRLGAVVAPQSPLLARYMESLPLILFGALSLLSGFLALLYPETAGSKLPDTVAEALAIGEARDTPAAKI